MRRAFASLDQRTPYLGGAFLPASIQFTTYVDAGRAVPATPDGRAAGEPLADSLGAVQGRDTAGPTALLRSVAKLPLQSALGTPVLNLRLQKQFLRAALRPLVLGAKRFSTRWRTPKSTRTSLCAPAAIRNTSTVSRPN